MLKEKQENRALLIVDLQNDFCTDGALAVDRGELIVEPVNNAMNYFDCIAATQDWHPEGHFSFASSHPGSEPFETVPFGKDTQILWPDHCIAGSRGAELHRDLDIKPIDLILRKGTNPQIDSYSAFYENDHTSSTGLAGWFRERGITHLVLCGLAADVCVYHTALDALACDFEVSLLTEGTKGIDTPPGSLARKMEELAKLGVRML